jgi:hypothetical protein
MLFSILWLSSYSRPPLVKIGFGIWGDLCVNYVLNYLAKIVLPWTTWPTQAHTRGLFQWSGTIARGKMLPRSCVRECARVRACACVPLKEREGNRACEGAIEFVHMSTIRMNTSAFFNNFKSMALVLPQVKTWNDQIELNNITFY